MEEVRPLRLRITQRAQAHLGAIQVYISDDNPVAAQRVGFRIRAACETLCSFPRIGRAGLAPGTREWPVRGLPYVIVYHVTDAELVIVGVFHSARINRTG
jgi:plasmid stabilization system protein ParE